MKQQIRQFQNHENCNVIGQKLVEIMVNSFVLHGGLPFG